jgi:hypothetical protein
MSTPLVAIIGCQARAHYLDAQRQTWVPTLLCDHQFFLGQEFFVGLGQGSSKQLFWEKSEDEVVLPVPDDYFSLPDKVQAAIQWALARSYDSLFVVDDDTYVNGANLASAFSDFAKHDYAGRQRPDSSYLSGAAYYLGPQAMNALADARVPSTVKADLGFPAFPYLEGWIHHVLIKNELKIQADPRIKFSNAPADKNIAFEEWDANTVADFEWSGREMFARHNQGKDSNLHVFPSVEWRLRNLEFQVSPQCATLQAKRF